MIDHTLLFEDDDPSLVVLIALVNRLGGTIDVKPDELSKVDNYEVQLTYCRDGRLRVRTVEIPEDKEG